MISVNRVNSLVRSQSEYPEGVQSDESGDPGEKMPGNPTVYSGVDIGGCPGSRDLKTGIGLGVQKISSSSADDDRRTALVHLLVKTFSK